MSLHVFVQGHRVARLETPDGFRHVLTYLPGVAKEHLVSLTMPVQGGNEVYEWPALHPFFQVRHTKGFEPVGLRMLWEWNEGMKRLQTRRTFAMPDWVESAPTEGLSKPAPAQKFASIRLGESPLLAPRKRSRPVQPAS